MYKKTNFWANMKEWADRKLTPEKTASLKVKSDQISEIKEICEVAQDQFNLQLSHQEEKGLIDYIESNGGQDLSREKLTIAISSWLDKKRVEKGQPAGIIKDSIASLKNSTHYESEHITDGIKLVSKDKDTYANILAEYFLYKDFDKKNQSPIKKSTAGFSPIQMERQAKGRQVGKQDIDKCRDCVFFMSDPGVTHLNKCNACVFFGLGGKINYYLPRSARVWTYTQTYPGFSETDLLAKKAASVPGMRKLGSVRFAADEKPVEKETPYGFLPEDEEAQLLELLKNKQVPGAKEPAPPSRTREERKKEKTEEKTKSRSVIVNLLGNIEEKYNEMQSLSLEEQKPILDEMKQTVAKALEGADMNEIDKKKMLSNLENINNPQSLLAYMYNAVLRYEGKEVYVPYREKGNEPYVEKKDQIGPNSLVIVSLPDGDETEGTVINMSGSEGEEGFRYLVRTPRGSNWYTEKQIRKASSANKFTKEADMTVNIEELHFHDNSMMRFPEKDKKKKMPMSIVEEISGVIEESAPVEEIVVTEEEISKGA